MSVYFNRICTVQFREINFDFFDNFKLPHVDGRIFLNLHFLNRHFHYLKQGIFHNRHLKLQCLGLIPTRNILNTVRFSTSGV